MLTNFLAAIPAELEDIWYVYDIILVAIIVLCAFALIFLRKRTNQVEAQKSFDGALAALKKAKHAKPSKVKIHLFTAKNMLNSAEYYFNSCIGDKDLYYLITKVDTARCAQEMLGKLLADFSKLDTAGISSRIDEVIMSLMLADNNTQTTEETV